MGSILPVAFDGTRVPVIPVDLVPLVAGGSSEEGECKFLGCESNADCRALTGLEETDPDSLTKVVCVDMVSGK